jgi:hypothetical protein
MIASPAGMNRLTQVADQSYLYLLVKGETRESVGLTMTPAQVAAPRADRFGQSVGPAVSRSDVGGLPSPRAHGCCKTVCVLIDHLEATRRALQKHWQDKA